MPTPASRPGLNKKDAIIFSINNQNTQENLDLNIKHIDIYIGEFHDVTCLDETDVDYDKQGFGFFNYKRMTVNDMKTMREIKPSLGLAQSFESKVIEDYRGDC